MAVVTIAAVQAAYVLMDQQACVDKAVRLLSQAVDLGTCALKHDVQCGLPCSARDGEASEQANR